MSPYIYLLVTMSVNNEYLIQVALKVDGNRFKDQYYLEPYNKKIIRQILEPQDEYRGPIVAVREIAGIVA